MSKEQIRMMNAEDKLLGEVDSPLTKLFRSVLIEMDMRPERWNNRLTAYLKSNWSRVRKTAKDIGQERNNFNRAISKREITWKTFFKAILISGPLRYSMSLTLTLRDGRVITVSTGDLPNPLADIDSLQKTIAGKQNPSHDITDYETESDEQYYDADEDADIVTMTQLTDTIDELPSSPANRAKRQRRSEIIAAQQSNPRQHVFNFDD